MYKSNKISTTSFSPEDRTLYSNVVAVSYFLKKKVPFPASMFPRLSISKFKQFAIALFSSPIIVFLASEGLQSFSFKYLLYFIFK